MTKPFVLSDLELPKSLILKLIKDHHNDQILFHRDSRLALIKSATVFISYLTATAQEIASNQGSGRTLSATHILKALDEIIDEEYLEDWKLEINDRLQQWKDTQTKNKLAKKITEKNVEKSDNQEKEESLDKLDDLNSDNENLEENVTQLELEEEDEEEEQEDYVKNEYDNDNE